MVRAVVETAAVAVLALAPGWRRSRPCLIWPRSGTTCIGCGIDREELDLLSVDLIGVLRDHARQRTQELVEEGAR